MASRYYIDVTLDFVNKQVTGFERLTFKNKITRFQKGIIIGFDLPGVEGYTRLEVLAEGKPIHLVPTEAASLEFEKRFYVELPESMQNEDVLTLECIFKGKLPNPERDMVFLIENWHPKLPRDKITFDDYEVTVTIPENRILVSTGLETEIKTLTDRQILYKQKAEKVKDFGLIISDRLEAVEGRTGDVLVRSYYLPETERWGRPLLDFALDAINFYRGEFGFYPQNKLSIIPGHKEYTGGWPVTSNVIAIHDLDKLGDRAESFARWIVAHEIGHQYWSGYVVCSEFPGWLDIGLGLYMDRCYAEARGLGLSHHQWLIKRYIQALREGVDTTVVQPPEKLQTAEFDWNNVIVHGKGYAIISMLEQILGGELFRQVFNEALRRFKHRDIGVKDFQHLCEELSGERLDWFFYQWLYTNRYLSYRIAHQEHCKQGDVYYLKVRIERLGDACMPIPVQATFQDGKKAIIWTNPALKITELTFTSSSPVQRVEIDPEGYFPIVYPPLEPMEIEAKREILALPWIGSGERAKRAYEKACKANLKSVSLWFKLGLTLYDGEFYDEAFQAFKKTVELSDEPIYVFAGLVWQGHILDLLGRRDEALKYYQKAREVHIETVMRHDQYGLIIDERWVEERLKSPFQRIDVKRHNMHI